MMPFVLNSHKSFVAQPSVQPPNISNYRVRRKSSLSITETFSSLNTKENEPDDNKYGYDVQNKNANGSDLNFPKRQPCCFRCTRLLNSDNIQLTENVSSSVLQNSITKPLMISPQRSFSTVSSQSPFSETLGPSFNKGTRRLSQPLTATYQESLLSGRTSGLQSNPIQFTAKIGVIRSGNGGEAGTSRRNNYKQYTIPFDAVYYKWDLNVPSVGNHDDDVKQSPYVGNIDLEKFFIEREIKENLNRMNNNNNNNNNNDNNKLSHSQNEKSTKKKKKKFVGDELPSSADSNSHESSSQEHQAEQQAEQEQKQEQKQKPDYGRRSFPGMLVPEKGLLQVIIYNQEKSVANFLLFPYDLSNYLKDENSKTFIRRNNYFANDFTKVFLSTIQFQFAKVKNNYVIYNNIKIIFHNRILPIVGASGIYSNEKEVSNDFFNGQNNSKDKNQNEGSNKDNTTSSETSSSSSKKYEITTGASSSLDLQYFKKCKNCKKLDAEILRIARSEDPCVFGNKKIGQDLLKSNFVVGNCNINTRKHSNKEELESPLSSKKISSSLLAATNNSHSLHYYNIHGNPRKLSLIHMNKVNTDDGVIKAKSISSIKEVDKSNSNKNVEEPTAIKISYLNGRFENYKNLNVFDSDSDSQEE
ncbi:hypothetical protein PACTADRAFT_83531 [Pachysolen tannophilus NRRL Y-2460]|uniref:Atos-like conserved domain-containing protein n=1 Tax=Pachysolen tannophilus NRRL Y-2460 TaxID=669874 RepID=A0A1E4U2I4_PACTA|nr:hypothetical protein PACTADRAFT_83531 [Pachysolen tannophilus NRRL Y-2460]